MTDGLKAYESWLNGIISPEDVMRERFVESPLAHPSAMIRAEVLRTVGGYREGGWPEDYALWLELLRRGHRLANVPEVLLRWRDRPDRLTRTDPAYALDALVRLKARYLALGPLAGGRCILWGAGKTGRVLMRELSRACVRVELFIDIDPAKIGRKLHGVEVVSPRELGDYRGIHLVAAVGAKGARALIRQHLVDQGWVEIQQFSCAA
jgi:hypothetical protein